jgi:hypothetical protein
MRAGTGHLMRERLHRIATCLAALAVSMLACNAPTQGITPPTPEPGPLSSTVEPAPPTLTSSLPEPTAPSLPTSAPSPFEPGFPITEPPGAQFLYATRSGDTLPALALRFGVEASQILADTSLTPTGYLPNGLALRIPNVLETMTPGGELLPDSEVVYSPAAADFDVTAFVAAAGGYLSRFSETLEDGTELSGAEVVQRVAEENSINPRLLLALLEFRAGWVYGIPQDADARTYPLGFSIPDRPGLYQELSVACSQLVRGYYGWRLGSLTETRPDDGGTVRWNPTLNAGSVAVLHVLALLSGTNRWLDQMVGPQAFPGSSPPCSAMARPGPIRRCRPTWRSRRSSCPSPPAEAEPDGRPALLPDGRQRRGARPLAHHSRRSMRRLFPLGDRRAGRHRPRRDHAVVLDLDADGRESTGWVLLYYHLA